MYVRVLDTTKNTAKLVKRVKTKRANTYIPLYNLIFFYYVPVHIYYTLYKGPVNAYINFNNNNNMIKADSVFPISKTGG